MDDIRRMDVLLVSVNMVDCGEESPSFHAGVGRERIGCGCLIVLDPSGRSGAGRLECQSGS
jgi:hypothetical protein